jgi:hypothetical protein
VVCSMMVFTSRACERTDYSYPVDVSYSAYVGNGSKKGTGKGKEGDHWQV